MSRAILEGMAGAVWGTISDSENQRAWDDLPDDKRHIVRKEMQAALWWLAENVHSDEFASALDAAASVKRGMQVNHTATDERVHFANKLRAALLEAAKDE